MTPVDWIQQAGATAAAVTALAVALLGAWRVLRRLARLADMLERVEQRSRELVTNGGGSVKDRSDQTARRLDAVEARIGRIEHQVAVIARATSREVE